MGREDKGVLVADIDPAEARDKALNPFNDRLSDRPPAFYHPLVEPLPDPQGIHYGIKLSALCQPDASAQILCANTSRSLRA